MMMEEIVFEIDMTAIDQQQSQNGVSKSVVPSSTQHQQHPPPNTTTHLISDGRGGMQHRQIMDTSTTFTTPTITHHPIHAPATSQQHHHHHVRSPLAPSNYIHTPHAAHVGMMGGGMGGGGTPQHYSLGQSPMGGGYGTSGMASVSGHMMTTPSSMHQQATMHHGGMSMASNSPLLHHSARQPINPSQFLVIKTEQVDMENNVTRHPMALARNSSGDIVCPYCEYRPADKFVLTRHIKAVHQKIRDFACPRCEKMTSRRYNLVKHIQTDHPDFRFIQCPNDCSTQFLALSPEDLNRHLRRMHKAVNKRKPTVNIHCPSCDKLFNRRYALIYHIQKHHGEYNLLQCPHDCRRNFFALSHQELRHHIESAHNAEKMAKYNKLFECPSCDKILTRHYRLVSHIQTEHTDVPLRPCPHNCKYIAISMIDLNRHILAVHKKKLATDQSRMKKCSVCPYQSPFNSKLKRHVVSVHGGEGGAALDYDDDNSSLFNGEDGNGGHGGMNGAGNGDVIVDGSYEVDAPLEYDGEDDMMSGLTAAGGDGMIGGVNDGDSSNKRRSGGSGGRNKRGGQSNGISSSKSRKNKRQRKEAVAAVASIEDVEEEEAEEDEDGVDVGEDDGEQEQHMAAFDGEDGVQNNNGMDVASYEEVIEDDDQGGDGFDDEEEDDQPPQMMAATRSSTRSSGGGGKSKKKKRKSVKRKRR